MAKHNPRKGMMEKLCQSPEITKNTENVLGKWLLNRSENGDRSSQRPQKALYCFHCCIFNGKFSNSRRLGAPCEKL